MRNLLAFICVIMLSCETENNSIINIEPIGSGVHFEFEMPDIPIFNADSTEIVMSSTVHRSIPRRPPFDKKYSIAIVDTLTLPSIIKAQQLFRLGVQQGVYNDIQLNEGVNYDSLFKSLPNLREFMALTAVSKKLPHSAFPKSNHTHLLSETAKNVLSGQRLAESCYHTAKKKQYPDDSPLIYAEALGNQAKLQFIIGFAMEASRICWLLYQQNHYDDYVANYQKDRSYLSHMALEYSIPLESFLRAENNSHLKQDLAHILKLYEGKNSD